MIRPTRYKAHLATMLRISKGTYKVVLNTEEVTSGFDKDDLLLRKLKSALEGRCSKDGYVKEILEIVARSDLYNDNCSLYAHFYADVIYKALVMSLDIGDRVYGVSVTVAETGILGTKDGELGLYIPKSESVKLLPPNYMTLYRDIGKIHVRIVMPKSEIMRRAMYFVAEPYFYEDPNQVQNLLLDLSGMKVRKEVGEKMIKPNILGEKTSILVRMPKRIRYTMDILCRAYAAYSVIPKVVSRIYSSLMDPLLDAQYETLMSILIYKEFMRGEDARFLIYGNNELKNTIANLLDRKLATKDIPKARMIPIILETSIVDSLLHSDEDIDRQQILAAQVLINVITDRYGKYDMQIIFLPCIPITNLCVELLYLLCSRYADVKLMYSYVTPPSSMCCWLIVRNRKDSASLVELRKLDANDMNKILYLLELQPIMTEEYKAFMSKITSFQNEILGIHHNFINCVANSDGMFQNINSLVDSPLYREYERRKKQYSDKIKERLKSGL